MTHELIMEYFFNRLWLSPLLGLTVLSLLIQGVPLQACHCSSSALGTVKNLTETIHPCACRRGSECCQSAMTSQARRGSCCNKTPTQGEGQKQGGVNAHRCQCGRLFTVQSARLFRSVETLNNILSLCHQIEIASSPSIEFDLSQTTWNRWAVEFGFPPLLSGAELCISLCRLTI